MRVCFFAALVGLCIAAPVRAVAPETGPAHLVADLNPGTVPWTSADTSFFSSFTRLGNRVVFLGFPPDDFQCGLFATDGTAAGTGRLADLCAESLDLSDSGQVRRLGASDRLAFFTDSLKRLWRTDGTAAGTFALGATVSPFGLPLVGPGGILYFAACDTAEHCEPWRSDGTVEGTRLLRAVQAGGRSTSFLLFATDGDRAVFSGVGPGGPTVWATDGTSRGTRALAILPDVVGSLAIVDGEIYASTRRSLWLLPPGRAARRVSRFSLDFRSPGVTLVKAGGRLLFVADLGDGVVDLREIGPRHQPRLVERFENGLGPIAEVNGGLILAAGADPLDSRFSLWTLAPGAGHPSLLAGCPGGCPAFDPFSSGFGRLAGRLVFSGQDGRGTELWETDGTGPGTHLVKDLCPGECDGSPSGFTPVLGRLIFSAGDHDLWVTDGTTAGTVQLGRILSSPVNGLDVAVLAGRAIFDGIDDVQGSQPWQSDLTPAGTAPLLTLGSGLAVGSSIQSLTPFGSGALFGACSPDGAGVWGSDGTEAGTVRLAASNQGCGEPFVGPVLQAGALAFFGLDGAHLWRTDGTPGGTSLLHSWDDLSFIRAAVPLKGRALLVMDPEGDSSLTTLWQSDGTPQGTVQTGTVELGGSPDLLGAVGEQAFFVAQRNDAPPFPFALWRTDGTTAGTRALVDLQESAPADLVAFGAKAMLVMEGGAGRQVGRELWTTDGTLAGTVPVISAVTGPRPVNPRALAVLQGDVYFFADSGDPVRPVSLWRSDGSAAGTVEVAGLPGNPSVLGDPTLVPAGGNLFFRLDDGVHGEELWRSDGTAAGTALVRDAAPGRAHSRAESLAAAGDRLYFTATDGQHGLELWTSDGTAAGTVMVQDVLPGLLSSRPRNLVAADGNLFFTADDGEHGRELWALPLEP